MVLSDGLLIGAVILTSFAGGAVAQDPFVQQPGLAPTFVSDYKEAVGRLDRHFGNVVGKFKHTGRFGIGSEHERLVLDEGNFARSKGMAKLIRRPSLAQTERSVVVDPVPEKLSESGDSSERRLSESVLVYSGEYFLKLKRSSRDQLYSVAHFDESAGQIRRSLDRLLARTCGLATAAGDIPVRELISSPRFSVTRVGRQFDSDGRSLLRVDFSMTPRPARPGATTQVARELSFALESC